MNSFNIRHEAILYHYGQDHNQLRYEREMMQLRNDMKRFLDTPVEAYTKVELEYAS